MLNSKYDRLGLLAALLLSATTVGAYVANALIFGVPLRETSAMGFYESLTSAISGGMGQALLVLGLAVLCIVLVGGIGFFATKAAIKWVWRGR